MHTPTDPAPGAASSPSSASWLRRLGGAGVLGVLWSALPAICGFVLLGQIGRVSDTLRNDVSYPVLAYTAVFIAAAGLGILPTYAQSILGGWVFGFAWGYPAALVGFVGASAVGYAIARTFARRRVEALIESDPRARAVRDALIGHRFLKSLGFVTLIRLPPNSPFAITNLLLASAGVRPLPFLLGTAIGMAPRTAITVAAAAAGGRSARDIQSFVKDGPGAPILIGGALVTVVILGCLGMVAKRAWDRVVAGAGQRPGGGVPGGGPAAPPGG